MIEIYCRDCMEAMAEMPDKAFDLAVVDPPYGIEKQISIGGGSHTKSSVKFHQMYSENHKKWDKAVPDKYFIELSRISTHQIVWGGNYYQLGFTRGFIVWDKPEMRIHTMSDCEFAWTNFDRPAKIIKISRRTRGISIHPTQKPVALYRWLLKNYAKPGDKILDTHLGSGSSAIAAYDLGFDFVGYEIDREYFEAAKDRLDRHMAQGRMFEPPKEEPPKPQPLFQEAR
jgi:site-specific DNA-methyltransferase (adenine-specific)